MLDQSRPSVLRNRHRTPARCLGAAAAHGLQALPATPSSTRCDDFPSPRSAPAKNPPNPLFLGVFLFDTFILMTIILKPQFARSRRAEMTSAHPLSPASHGAIASLEHTTLPPDLDGRQGSNRAGGVRAQIAAVCDIDAIKAWLARYVDSPATLTSYRKESRAPALVGGHRTAQATLFAHSRRPARVSGR
jgi:hypothetical protein